MKKRILQARNISVENFKDYGVYISSGSRKPDADIEELKSWNRLGVMDHQGNTSISIVETYSKNGLIEQTLERHQNTGETLIPCGDVILVVTLGDNKNSIRPDPDTACAFMLKAGDAVTLHPGIWHHAPLTREESVKTFVIFQADTPEKDFFALDLEETFGFYYEVNI